MLVTPGIPFSFGATSAALPDPSFRCFATTLTAWGDLNWARLLTHPVSFAGVKVLTLLSTTNASLVSLRAVTLTTPGIFPLSAAAISAALLPAESGTEMMSTSVGVGGFDGGGVALEAGPIAATETETEEPGAELLGFVALGVPPVGFAPDDGICDPFCVPPGCVVPGSGAAAVPAGAALAGAGLQGDDVGCKVLCGAPWPVGPCCEAGAGLAPEGAVCALRLDNREIATKPHLARFERRTSTLSSANAHCPYKR